MEGVGWQRFQSLKATLTQPPYPSAMAALWYPGMYRLHVFTVEVLARTGGWVVVMGGGGGEW